MVSGIVLEERDLSPSAIPSKVRAFAVATTQVNLGTATLPHEQVPVVSTAVAPSFDVVVVSNNNNNSDENRSQDDQGRSPKERRSVVPNGVLS